MKTSYKYFNINVFKIDSIILINYENIEMFYMFSQNVCKLSYIQY